MTWKPVLLPLAQVVIKLMCSFKKKKKKIEVEDNNEHSQLIVLASIIKVGVVGKPNEVATWHIRGRK